MDSQGVKQPTGSEGEICTRGRNVMLGYLNVPDATRKAFFGSWLRTGISAIWTMMAICSSLDRLKDLIITGGENVYPREVEETLYLRPRWPSARWWACPTRNTASG